MLTFTVANKYGQFKLRGLTI